MNEQEAIERLQGILRFGRFTIEPQGEESPDAAALHMAIEALEAWAAVRELRVGTWLGCVIGVDGNRAYCVRSMGLKPENEIACELTPQAAAIAAARKLRSE